MMKSSVIVAAIVTACAVGSATVPAAGQTPQATRTAVEDIRSELLQLPYYGVFDFLAFNYNRGTVTLMGYAYQASLKRDAEAAVRRASGVDQVVNKIEELPANSMDDTIRWQTYYRIYRDPFLSRYAPGGAGLWGHSHPFGNAFLPMGSGAFAGYEPAGDYPIHIIVKSGRVTLLGVVDNESDKTLAAARAREVPGTFGLDNQLEVEKSSHSQ